VVDDERPAREELRWLLEQCDGVEVVGEAAGGEQARDAIASLDAPPDVVFLDIDMPGVDGIRFAECLDRFAPVPLTIFVTAYEDYAVDAFGVDAVDYLMKPVRLERLQEAVGRARERRAAEPEAGGQEEDSPIRRLSVRDDDGYHVLDAEEILYFESDQGEVYAVAESGRFPTDFNLRALESQLPSAEFFRSHRSYIVRVDAIENIEPTGGGTYRLHLSGASDDGGRESPMTPLARSRTDELERRIPWSTDALEQR
jgi:DNA-binding LytR/AlgR family response regulator